MTHLEFDCSDEKAVALLRASRLYDEGVKPAEWISVKDRLPEHNVLVLCVWLDGRDKKQNRGFATYQQHGVWYVSNEGMPEVTHWMPLPEPPKEE